MAQLFLPSGWKSIPDLESVTVAAFDESFNRHAIFDQIYGKIATTVYFALVCSPPDSLSREELPLTAEEAICDPEKWGLQINKSIVHYAVLHK